jgi:hypothetical protein
MLEKGLSVAVVICELWRLTVVVVDKVASVQIFFQYFGFPCQNHSFHQLFHPHNHPGQVQ